MRLLVVVWLLLSTTPAYADWCLSGYLGAPYTLPSALRVELPPDTDVRFDSVVYTADAFSFPIYYGYRFGYCGTARFGVEAEIIHLKVFADPGHVVARNGRIGGRTVADTDHLGNVVQHFGISHGLNLLFLNAVVRRPAASLDRRLTWVARVGAGPTVPHAESTIATASREQYELGKLAMQAAGGVEVRLWRRVQAIGEYKFTWTRQTVGVAGGEASAQFATHHVVFGIGSWARRK